MNSIERMAIAAFPFLALSREKTGVDPFLEKSRGGVPFEDYRLKLESRQGSVRERALAWLHFYGVTDSVMSVWLNPYVNMLLRWKVAGTDELKCADPRLGVFTDGFSKDVIGDESVEKSLGKDAFEALKNDGVSEFVMLMDLGRFKIGKKLAERMMMSRGCENIIVHLLKTSARWRKMMTPRQMLLYGCGGCPSIAKSEALVEAAVEHDPTCVKGSDFKGMTPLHYTFFKRVALEGYQASSESGVATSWIEDLERRLIALGCDPDAEDGYGLSWRNIHDAM